MALISSSVVTGYAKAKNLLPLYLKRPVESWEMLLKQSETGVFLVSILKRKGTKKNVLMKDFGEMPYAKNIVPLSWIF